MRVGSLFAGIGGFDLAARWMGWRTVWYSEIDPYASAVMKKRFPEAVNLGDITKIDGKQAPPVDILCGGFPCQDISLAGKGAGITGSRSGLWSEYARLIDETRPRYVVAENVSALRSRGLDRVLRDLMALGYDAEWHCIPAAYVGAPHRRDRIWIVAHSDSTGPHAGALPGLYPSEAGDGARDGEPERLRGALAPTALAHPVGVTAQLVGAAGLLGGAPSADQVGEEERQRLRDAADGGSADVADAELEGREGWLHRREDSGREGVPGHAGCGSAVREQSVEDWWAVEPDVGRVAHGVPSRVDRLRCLGNAVVPQVPLILFQAIAEREQRVLDYILS